MLDQKTRYLQIAFNYNLGLVQQVLPRIVHAVRGVPGARDRLLMEAGTPFIKREGLTGIRLIRSLWGGKRGPRLDVILQVAQKLGVSVEEIMGLDEPPEFLLRHIPVAGTVGDTAEGEPMGEGPWTLAVRDDSLVPEIRAGMRVIIERTTVEPGDRVAFMTEGAWAVRVYHGRDQGVELASLNGQTTAIVLPSLPHPIYKVVGVLYE